MKRKLLVKKLDNDLVVINGTDIPVCSSREFMIWLTFKKLKENKNELILTFKEIFEEHTFKRKEQFIIISRMIKNKMIRRNKISNDKYIYGIIPKDDWGQCTGMHIYNNLTWKENRKLKNHLSKS
jgi:hypothetical protein